jgi:hypothetical protein
MGKTLEEGSHCADLFATYKGYIATGEYANYYKQGRSKGAARGFMNSRKDSICFRLGLGADKFEWDSKNRHVARPEWHGVLKRLARGSCNILPLYACWCTGPAATRPLGAS